jgi:ATP-dependent Clp protease ATP-binding subunit ClpC
MIPLPKYLEDRFTQRAKNTLISACKIKNAQPIHLLHALACEPGSLAKNILETHKITGQYIARYDKVTKSPPRNRAKKITISRECKEIIKRSAQIASNQNQPYIGTEHLLYAIVTGPNPVPDVSRILTDKKITQIKKHLDTIFSQNIDLSSFPSILRHKGYTGGINHIKNMHKSAKGNIKIKKGKKESKSTPAQTRRATQTPALDAFCENLTALAQAQVLDPVIGREKEVSRIINILLRRSKNNPLLIGEPGVGKTAIVQGLAQRIHNGEVPSQLLHKNIISLNLNSLVAGTMFRGDFEARMQDVIEEASNDNIILFIDEIHTVIGTGSAQGSLDVANILKPALSQGTIQCMGATTLDEYRKYIEKDRALERRLQVLVIEEESERESIATLLQLKKLYEKHHGISIDDEAAESAVTLSARYIRDRFLPDKALDVLDEAAARLKSKAAITNHTKKIRDLEKQRDSLTRSKEKSIREENYQDAIVLKYKEGLAEEELKQFKKKFALSRDKIILKKSDIEQTVEEMTGVPIQNDRSVQELKKLSTALAKEIIGQKQAISEIIETIKRNKAGIRKPSRPVGSFLFIGPVGVGKTALAKALAEHNAQTLIKIDMSEYAEPHTISRLIGSPPGYVGYGESGELTEKIRRYPYAVVLFDEVEKAHPQVHNLLLSILEDGMLEDSSGRSASFKNAIIVMTSNAGSDESGQTSPLGFSKSSKETETNSSYIKEIRDTLRPEIINRIDRIVPFKHLGKKEIFDITKLFIEKLRLQLPHLNISISEEAIKNTAQKAYKPKDGARHVRSTIEQLIEGPLAEHLIRHNKAKSIKIGLRGGKIVVS